METYSNRRLIENEVIFKELNVRLKVAVERSLVGKANNLPLEFYCECSNEICRERIRLEPDVFMEVHRDSRHFIAKKGHEVAAIEKIVIEYDDYNVVEKNTELPKETDMRLNKTDL